MGLLLSYKTLHFEQPNSSIISVSYIDKILDNIHNPFYLDTKQFEIHREKEILG